MKKQPRTRWILLFIPLATLLLLSGCNATAPVAETPAVTTRDETTVAETTIVKTVVSETTAETTVEILETVTEKPSDGRERFYAHEVEDIVERLEAESKLEDLTFIVFDRYKGEFFLLEDGDCYDFTAAEMFLVYCSAATDFKQDAESYKKITQGYRWYADYAVVEVAFKNFNGAVQVTFMKSSNQDVNKTLTISLDKSLQDGEWDTLDYYYSHVTMPARN